VRVDPGHLPVPVELPEHDLVRVQRAEAAEDLFPGCLQARRVQAGRGFDGDLGGHLEQVRDEHVQDRAGGIVELRPVADAERLGTVTTLIRAEREIDHKGNLARWPWEGRPALSLSVIGPRAREGCGLTG
jgi:hypothetical protein